MSIARWKRLRLPAVVGLGLAVGALAVVAANPADAAVPDRFGFVLFNGSTVVPSGTTPAGTTVALGPPGRYKVTFPAQAAKGGVVHVTAINPKPHWCQVDWFGPVGANESVLVSCYRIGGVREKSAFSLIFNSSTGKVPGPGRFGYVDVQPSGAIISQYNSVGSPNAVAHSGPGVWMVKFPGLSTPGPQDGSLQATAVSPNVGARCKINKWASGAGGQLVRVVCFNSAGAPFDTRFNLSYQYQRALYGAAFPPKNFGYVWNKPPTGPPSTNFNSVFGPGINTITPAGTGLSLVTYKGIGVAPDDVQVTAVGGKNEFCGLNTAWARISGAAVVRDVNCFTNTGAPINTGFFASYNSRF